MSAVDTNFYEKKKSSAIIFAFLFLVIVIAGTGFLIWSNMKIEEEISALKSDASALSQSIRQEKASPLVATYSTYDRYKNDFAILDKRSKIPLIANHLKSITRSYNLQSKGFSLTAGSVTTAISTDSTTSSQAYQNIVSFMREYPQREDALFDIDPVSQFSGHDTMDYSASFNLK